MSWSVCIAERPLALGNLDNIAYGQDVSHSFLRIKNAQGETVLEIHGMAYDPKNNRLEDSPKTLRSCFSAAAFMAVGHQSKYAPRLRAICIDKQDDMYKSLPPKRPVVEHQPVLKGSKESVMARVETALRAATEINSADLAYYAADLKKNGQNCHSVMAQLVKKMTNSPDYDLHLNYAAPGLHNNLVDRIPGLADIGPDPSTDPKTINNSVESSVRSLSRLGKENKANRQAQVQPYAYGYVN